MKSSMLKGNWNEMKEEAHKRWGRLTSNDIEQVRGRCEQLLGRIQRAYGLTKDEAQRQIEAFEEICDCGSRDTIAMDRLEYQTRATAGAGLSPDETEEHPRPSEPRTQNHHNDSDE